MDPLELPKQKPLHSSEGLSKAKRNVSAGKWLRPIKQQVNKREAYRRVRPRDTIVVVPWECSSCILVMCAHKNVTTRRREPHRLEVSLFKAMPKVQALVAHPKFAHVRGGLQAGMLNLARGR